MFNEKEFLKIIDELLSSHSNRIQKENNLTNRKKKDEVSNNKDFMDNLEKIFFDSYTSNSYCIYNNLIKLIKGFSELHEGDKKDHKYKEKKEVVLLILNKIKIKNKVYYKKYLKPDGLFQQDNFIYFFEFKEDKGEKKEKIDYWKTVFYIFIGWIYKHIFIYLNNDDSGCYIFNAISLNYIFPNNVTKNKIESIVIQYDNKLSQINSYISTNWKNYNCFFPKIDFGDFNYENIEGIFEKIFDIFNKDLIMSEEEMKEEKAINKEHNDNVRKIIEDYIEDYNKTIEELQEIIKDDDLTLNQKNTNCPKM